MLNSHDDYQLINNCAGTLASGSTCTLVVTFTPTATGAIPSSITLTDNDHNIAGSTQNITLTGSAVAPPAPIAQLTPLTFTFPDTAESTTSTTTDVVTLKNIGTAALIISGLSYTGVSFGESSTCTVGTGSPYRRQLHLHGQLHAHSHFGRSDWLADRHGQLQRHPGLHADRNVQR